MPPIQILAFDPGHTTGVVVSTLTGPRDFVVTSVSQLSWEERFHILTLIRLHQPCVVVAEDFRLFAHAAKSQINSPFPAVRVIGLIDAYCHLEGVKLHLQQPSVRSNVKVPDKALELTKALPHAREAYRHLRYFVFLRGRKLWQ